MDVQKPSAIKKLLSILGPGFITGAADDDPTAIAAYTQAGAQFGYGQLWTALYTLPFMTVIQEACGRIGLVTGKGLAGVMKMHYSKRVLFAVVSLLLVANTINLGADLGAMAASGQLLVDVPFSVWLVGITTLTLVLEVFVSYQSYAKFLKYLTLFLLAYVAVAFLVRQDWTAIAFATLVPSVAFNKTYLLSVLAIVGTNISPYLFFWQAGEEVEEEVTHHQLRMMGKGMPRVGRADVKKMKFDTAIGMIFSNLIVFFIAVAAASAFGGAHIESIETPAQAALALRPLAGDFASALFAIGVIGSGLLAIPVLAGSASYALAESFGWKEGLYRKLKQAHGFYGIVAVATFIGLLLNFSPIHPFRMLVYSAALNAIVAPVMLVVILRIANSRKIMGEFVSSRLSNALVVLATILVGGATISFIWTLLA